MCVTFGREQTDNRFCCVESVCWFAEPLDALVSLPPLWMVKVNFQVRSPSFDNFVRTWLMAEQHWATGSCCQVALYLCQQTESSI